jgi:hypothetical protein
MLVSETPFSPGVFLFFPYIDGIFPTLLFMAPGYNEREVIYVAEVIGLAETQPDRAASRRHRGGVLSPLKTVGAASVGIVCAALVQYFFTF